MSNKNKQPNPVIQDWVLTLDWKKQSALLSVLRGPDIFDDNTMAKNIVKMLRYLILNNADTRTNYMTNEVISSDIVIETLTLVDIKLKEAFVQCRISGRVEVTNHWYDHIVYAISIIANNHPSNYVRSYWSKINDELSGGN